MVKRKPIELKNYNIWDKNGKIHHPRMPKQSGLYVQILTVNEDIFTACTDLLCTATVQW